MIDRRTFIDEWKRLCRRFDRELDAEEASEYLGYLASQMSTEEFVEASRFLWAVRRFFPKPADFVRARDEGDTRAQEYEEYLCSDHWRAIRAWALLRAGGSCERCEARSQLQVHHRNYRSLGAEHPEDVEVLCDTCHRAVHLRGSPDA